jgi:hypothetical protein
LYPNLITFFKFKSEQGDITRTRRRPREPRKIRTEVGGGKQFLIGHEIEKYLAEWNTSNGYGKNSKSAATETDTNTLGNFRELSIGAAAPSPARRKKSNPPNTNHEELKEFREATRSRWKFKDRDRPRQKPWWGWN